MGRVLGRLEPNRTCGGVRVAGVARGRARGLPQVGEGKARHRFHFLDVGSDAVDHKRRLTVLIVTSDDTTDFLRHDWSPVAAAAAACEGHSAKRRRTNAAPYHVAFSP